MLGTIFGQFVEASPVTVTVRAIMERTFAADALDELFEQTAQKQYTRDLLFSDVVVLMSLVTCGIRPSVYAAYKASSSTLGISSPALYSKLNGIEPQVSQALVRYTATELAPIIEQLGGPATPLLPGYQLRIIDGNSLGSTDHRLEVLRCLTSGALPGKSLAVLDPDRMLVVDEFPCEDAYTQERALLASVLETVMPQQVWIADRNMCTRGFLHGLAYRQAYFVIREHENLPWQALNPLKFVGNSPTGKVFEQLIVVEFEGHSLQMRRVVIELDEPTQDGDSKIALVSNLPQEHADALKVAQLYQNRWSVEGLFQVVTDHFHCELKTLGYPQAALFTFCMALVAYNIFAVLKTALSSVHGAGKIDAGISNYYLAEEVSGTYRGMMIAIPDGHWLVFAQMSLEEFCDILQTWAAQVDLKCFSSAPRTKKKKRPKPKHNPQRPHVSTARLLAERKK